MNNFESTEPKERIISSSKGNGCVSFYNHYFSFKLEKDHTPRKIKYREIDKQWLCLFLQSLLFFQTRKGPHASKNRIQRDRQDYT